MSTDKQIEQLTKDLMQGAVEKPSASLMGRIMVRVMQEHQQIRRVKVESSPIIKWIFIGIAVYLIVAVALLAFFLSAPGAVSEAGAVLKSVFPVAITLFGGVSMFVFFGYLDNLLRLYYKTKEKTEAS